jgi:hypothetical protein
VTVRAWFTISALVLAALAAAFAFRLFSSIPAPEIIVRVGEDRLDGALVAYCWPQRTGTECVRQDADPARAEQIPASGSMRFIVTYPVQPDEGRLTFRDAETGESIVTSDWTGRLPYELPPGRYTIDARADYPDDSYVRYVFAVTTIPSGS